MSRDARTSQEVPANVRAGVATSEYYDDIWKQFGTSLDYTEVNRIDFIVTSIRELVGEGGLRILDLGCGRGWMAPFLSPLGDVVGIDFSSSGIEFARTHYADHGDFVLADPERPRLGLSDDIHFDVVACSEVIEHVPDRAQLVRDIRSFLRPGGWCMLTTPNGNVWNRFSRDPRYASTLQPIENWVTTAELRRILEDQGFRVVRHEGRAVYEFRVGPTRWLQTRPVEALFAWASRERLHRRLIRPGALYQLVAAERIR